MDYSLVTPGKTDDDAYLNAKLSISIARKLGATIWYAITILSIFWFTANKKSLGLYRKIYVLSVVALSSHLWEV